jgi:hypothetical protein
VECLVISVINIDDFNCDGDVCDVFKENFRRKELNKVAACAKGPCIGVLEAQYGSINSSGLQSVVVLRRADISSRLPSFKPEGQNCTSPPVVNVSQNLNNTERLF